jgi:hypothetical protein
MDMKLHLLETFAADGNDGVTYKVHGYERLVRDDSLADGQDHWEPTGVAEYRLASGELVDMQGDGSMRVVATGVRLARH